MSDDLIKRSDAIKAINVRARIPHDVASAHYANMAINAIRSVPSADRPRGEWIRTAEKYIGDDVSGFYDYHWACSECEREAIINEWNIYELSDYCPHCGAKMKGADDE